MKYIKVTGHKVVDILLNIALALIGIGVIAYGAGYLYGVIFGCC